MALKCHGLSDVASVTKGGGRFQKVNAQVLR